MLLAQVIYDVHQDFGLGHKVVATTTDNGANYVARRLQALWRGGCPG